MSDSGDARKLVGMLVPEGACFTKQGPRVRRENGQFAPMTFEKVQFAVLPEKTVRWLFESLPLIVDGILMLDDRLIELRGAVGKLQGSVDQVILRLDHALIAELEHARTLLRRADSKGKGAKDFLAEKEKDIVVPLRKVELRIEGRLGDTGLPPKARVCLMERFLMLRHVQAKISLACGDGDEARELLRATRERILPLAMALFAELTNGVAVLDVPEANSPGNDQKLLLLMEIIDGEAPDDRRFRLRKSAPVVPGKESFLNLEPAPRDVEIHGKGGPHAEPGTWVQKGQVVGGDIDDVWVAPVSGYLYRSPGKYGCSRWDFTVLAIPTLGIPRPGLANLIAELAFIVDYARGLEEEMDAASGNSELAKRLFAPDGGEPTA